MDLVLSTKNFEVSYGDILYREVCSLLGLSDPDECKNVLENMRMSYKNEIKIFEYFRSIGFKTVSDFEENIFDQPIDQVINDLHAGMMIEEINHIGYGI